MYSLPGLTRLSRHLSPKGASDSLPFGLRYVRPTSRVPFVSRSSIPEAHTRLIREAKMKVQTVKGAADVNLHVREYGKSTGVPILLIHGWSQSHLCWSKQYGSVLKDDARIVALDLRGHGMSDAPAETINIRMATNGPTTLRPSSISLRLTAQYWSAGHTVAMSFRTMCVKGARARL